MFVQAIHGQAPVKEDEAQVVASILQAISGSMHALLAGQNNRDMVNFTHMPGAHSSMASRHAHKFTGTNKQVSGGCMGPACHHLEADDSRASQTASEKQRQSALAG